MTTLFNSDLSCREFASRLLFVPDLLEWVKTKHLHLRTTPPIEGYEFVQVEALLQAIMVGARGPDLTWLEAREVVMNDDALKDHPMARTAPVWVAGLPAHEAQKKWRVKITDAIQAGELVLLDFASKLPIETQPAPEQSTPTPAPVLPAGASVTPPKQRIQESRILELLTAQGYEPLTLSQRTPGKPGPKAEIRTLALTEPALFSRSSFDKAWERLRNDGAVAGAE